MTSQFWNDRYGQDEYVYGTKPNTFLENSIDYIPSDSLVLSIAEGEGRNAVFLARQKHHVTAIDIASAGKDKAEKLAKENNVLIDYIITDVNDFNFGEDKWDAIVSIFAHTDPETRRTTLQKSLKGLKNGGIFLIEAYHPEQLLKKYGTGGPSQLDWLVTLDELKAAFKGQRILLENESERLVLEGNFHTGKAFVTQLICQKTLPV